MVNLYFEVMGIEYVRRILEEVRRSHLVIQDLNLNQAALMTKEGTAFTLTIRHSRDIRNEELVDRFSELEGVVIVDEI